MQILAEKHGGARPRLLVVAREMVRGGAAYLALHHMAKFVDQYEVDLVVVGPSDRAMLQELPARVRVYLLEARATSDEPIAAFLTRQGDLPPFRTCYDVALATSIFPDVAACAAFVAVRARRRFAFLVDESLSEYFTFDPRRRRVIASAIRWADLVLPVSQRLWERMAQACPPLRERPWQRLFPPIDRAAIQAQSQRPQTSIVPDGFPVAVTVARLVPGKQVRHCIRVHHRLSSLGVRFRWYVVGTGPEEHSLREEVQRLGLQERFYLLGAQDSPYPYLKAADLFVLFSASEGCPTVIREALALELPVLTTDVNGADELVEQERTGLIVPNNLDAMVAGLFRLLREERLRLSMRQTLQQRASGSREGEPELVSLLRAHQGTPRISILIPTYNQEHLVDKAIASALAQDYPSLEVVVLDDASRDGTAQVAQRWENDPRFRYVRNPSNLGRVANYLNGVTVARGDWLLMLDGDDYLVDPGFLSRAVAALARHADRPVLFAQAGHTVRHLDGSRPDVDILPPIESDEQVLSGGEYLRLVFESGFFTHLGALYDRRAALRAGFYTADVESSDMASFFRLALEGEALLLKTVAGCWIQHGRNASSTLMLPDVVPNIRLFGAAARRAADWGQARLSDLADPLLRHEAATLLHLFRCAVAKSGRGPASLLKLLWFAIVINPRLLTDHPFLRGVLDEVRPLLRVTTQRSALRRMVRRCLSRAIN